MIGFSVVHRTFLVSAALVAVSQLGGCEKAKNELLDQVRDPAVLAQQKESAKAAAELDLAVKAAVPVSAAAPLPTAASAAAPAAAEPAGPALGRKRFAIEPGPTQLIEFTTDAPVETIRGQSNAAAGFVDVDLDHPGQGLLAEVSVPVAELRTGIALRDEHMRSDQWLDAEKFPAIKLVLKLAPPQTQAIRAGAPVKATVTASLTIHGVTRDVEIADMSVAYLPFDTSLEKVHIAGDVLRVKGSWQIKLSDYGVIVPDQLIGKKVSNEVELRVALSAVAPAAKQ